MHYFDCTITCTTIFVETAFQQSNDFQIKILRCSFSALAKFRGTEDNHEEIAEMKKESDQIKSEPKVTIRDVFTNKFLRKVTIIAILLMVMQQFSGINAVRLKISSL